MAGETLELTFDDVAAEVSHHLGFGRTVSSLPVAKYALVSARIKAGLSRFYNERSWGFLKPTRKLLTVADQYVYVLPAYVGSIEGNLFFDPETSACEVSLTNLEIIMRMRQSNQASGRPCHASLRPQMADGVIPQVNELVLWPTPDAKYTLTYKARILPNMLSSAEAYALGGPPHSYTLLASCLTRAALRDDDSIGELEADYQRLLAQSIDYDARTYAPRMLGTFRNSRRSRPEYRTPNITIEIES